MKLENSRVPLGWLFILLSCSGSALVVAVGAGIYAGRVEGQSSSALTGVSELRTEGNERDAVLRIIDERLSRIEGSMGLDVGKPLVPRVQKKK